MNPPDLISASEAATILHVSYRTVKRYAKEGILPPAHKMRGDTGAYLFNRCDVEAFAAQRAEQAS